MFEGKVRRPRRKRECGNCVFYGTDPYRHCGRYWWGMGGREDVKPRMRACVNFRMKERKKK